MYEYYQFFKHKMIDTSLKDSIDIKYFIDTKYTIENLFLREMAKHIL